MKKYLDEKLIGLRWRTEDFLTKMMEEEKGDTNFVSIIIIMVIVLGIAAIFKSQLTDAVNAVMGKLMDFVNK